jgi:hypothetical protein
MRLKELRGMTSRQGDHDLVISKLLEPAFAADTQADYATSIDDQRFHR